MYQRKAIIHQRKERIINTILISLFVVAFLSACYHEHEIKQYRQEYPETAIVGLYHE